MSNLRLIHDERQITDALTAPLDEKLLRSIIIYLVRDVKELKRQVKELQHCQHV